MTPLNVIEKVLPFTLNIIILRYFQFFSAGNVFLDVFQLVPPADENYCVMISHMKGAK